LLSLRGAQRRGNPYYRINFNVEIATPPDCVGMARNDRGKIKKKTGPVVFPDLLSQGFEVDEILYIYIISLPG